MLFNGRRRPHRIGNGYGAIIAGRATGCGYAFLARLLGVLWFSVFRFFRSAGVVPLVGGCHFLALPPAGRV